MTRPNPPVVPPVRGRHWYLRSYLRGAGAIFVAVSIAFLLSREVVARMASSASRVSGVSSEVIRAAIRERALTIGIEWYAPVHEQFAAFLTTRLGYPPILTFLVGGALLTVALWWRSRRSPRPY